MQHEQNQLTTYLSILESAISDVGHWRWWTANLPDSVQLEFGGVQLWSPPSAPDTPPSGLIALRLIRPQAAIFLTKAHTNLPVDWHDAMQRDELQPFGMDRDQFTLSSVAQASHCLNHAATTHALVAPAGNAGATNTPAVIGFWAGPIGFYGVADELEIYNMSGRLTPAQVEASSHQWWEYWREYWRERHGPNPKPRDYACEVTIPAAAE